MFVITEVASRQYKLSAGDVIDIPYISNKKEVMLDKVLMMVSGKEINIGAPYLKDTKVVCEVIGQKKGEKTIAYKYRKREGYHRKVGFRDLLTRVKVKEIVTKPKE